VQGFYTKDELERLIQRRSTRTPLGATFLGADFPFTDENVGVLEGNFHALGSVMK